MGAYVMGLLSVLRLTLSKKPEWVESRKELAEYGQKVVEHPAETAGKTVALLTMAFARILFFIIFLVLFIGLVVAGLGIKQDYLDNQSQRLQQREKLLPPCVDANGQHSPITRATNAPCVQINF
jgi:hypothetical protein